MSDIITEVTEINNISETNKIARIKSIREMYAEIAKAISCEQMKSCINGHSARFWKILPSNYSDSAPISQIQFFGISTEGEILYSHFIKKISESEYNIECESYDIARIDEIDDKNCTTELFRIVMLQIVETLGMQTKPEWKSHEKPEWIIEPMNAPQ